MLPLVQRTKLFPYTTLFRSAEQRRFAHAVGAHDAHDAGARQREAQTVEQFAVAEALMHVIGLEHHIAQAWAGGNRSEEHTSELQSRGHLVCRLLLEKKNKRN